MKSHLSCEPTYEELKPLLRWKKPSPSQSCEPTYEELKPTVGGTKAWIGGSCEPTYEELKQDLIRTTIEFDTVASLPMRNWNKI